MTASAVHAGGAEAARGLAAALRAQGWIADPRWEQAIADVHRHLFAPSRFWAQPTGGSERAIDAGTAPDEWLRLVYSVGTAIITQRDDGATPVADRKGVPSSSLSDPAVVAGFLELLDVRDGNTVLEIGTGTGWTAALLSHRLGSGQVTTMDIDEQVTANARENLKGAGYDPQVITGDGAEGWPAGAPYDRVHVTCGVSRIPYAWVQQCRAGGVIVLPWLPAGYGGHQLRLRTGLDGRAVGRFRGGCGFMMMRSQRTHWSARHQDQAGTSVGRLDPREIAGADPGLHLMLAALMPGVTQMGIHDDDGSFSLLLSGSESAAGSWAAADYLPATGRVDVTQYGDRRLWDETESAFGAWLAAGAPGRKDFGLSLDADGQRVWLRAPEQVITPYT